MMMKRNVWLIGFAAVAVGVGVFFSVRRGGNEETSAVAAPPPMVSASLNELPNLRVTFGDKSSVILRELTGNIALIFFNPECEHCHQEAEQIAAERSAFDGWEVYFIASVEATQAEEFGVKYKLTDPNFHFGSASVSEVYESVGQLNEVPTIILFKNRMYLERYDGVTSLAELKKNLSL